jgi:putative Mg2+ transporter-C (MgtC) family protein
MDFSIMQMPLHPTWGDIAIRITLTIIAGALIGSNRESRGHAAGLRTTILVCLAASVAMIQVNMLLPLAGKTSDGFSVMDLMRLPLGILTGVGFIGGGSILKKGDLVIGVTTAATLWIVTVIGLCLGGGQLILGIGATLISLITIWLLKWVDLKIPREYHAFVWINMNAGNIPPELNTLINPLGYRAHLLERRYDTDTKNNKFLFEIFWKRPENAPTPFDLINILEENYFLESFNLKTEARM